MRPFIWLFALAALLVVALQAAGAPLPDTAHAQEADGGMSLAVKNDCDDTAELSLVQAGEPFVVCVSADPAPSTSVAGPVQGISGFATEVLFTDGLEWRPRPQCTDEVQITRADPNDSFAICLAFTTSLLRGAGHAVLSAAEFPVPPLSFGPGSTSTLIEMDFVCRLGGSYTLVLAAVPDSDFGSIYGDLDANQISLRTVEFDYDGDTVPNQVADFTTLECNGPTATPCPASGCPTATDPPPPTPFPLSTSQRLTATAELLAAARTPRNGGDNGAFGFQDPNENGGGGTSVWLWVGLGAAAAVLAGGAAFDGYRRFSRRQRG